MTETAAPVQNALDKYAAALEMTERGTYTPDAIAVSSGDPFRPADLSAAPGNMTHNPPKCPRCSTFLYPMSQNTFGDIDFQCLNASGMNICGYETIYRVTTRTWEQHPSKPLDPEWVEPGRVFNRTPVAAETPAVVTAPDGTLSIRAAAERLGCEPSDLGALIAEGKLTIIKHEGKSFIAEALIAEIEASRATSTDAPSDNEGDG